MIEVVHKNKSNYDIYIGRPSIWGNPFVIGQDGSRSEVVEKYAEYILSKPELLEKLHELKDKKLACFCAPLACHGDILKALAEEL